MENSINKEDDLKEILSAIYEEILVFTASPHGNSSNQNVSMNNLRAYLHLKDKFDKRMHTRLMEEGLSSFKDIHTHIHYSLSKMIQRTDGSVNADYVLDPKLAYDMKSKRVNRLFGRKNHSIMVTLHASMELNAMKELLAGGMNIARINCAHDTPEVWKRLVNMVRQAERETKLERPPCKIYMDLAGPKIRVKKIIKSKKISDGRAYLEVAAGDEVTIIKTPYADHTSADHPNMIVITSEKALANVRVNDKIYFNDGKIAGEVIVVSDAWIRIKILKTHKNKAKLKEESGLNLPESFVHFMLPALIEEDIKHLPLICKLADIIGLSFVHHPKDLIKLRNYLQTMPPKEVGVIAKIETREALHSLANIIQEGLNFDSFGVMIARGDLAVELGFSQLAMTQEEILNLCSAAHIPVIWATGVLENQTKKGLPMRTELTDVYMGLRADCIMLNKGKYIQDALIFLNELIKISEHKTVRGRLRDCSFFQYGF